MNLAYAKDYLPLIKAAALSKTIQCQDSAGKWINSQLLNFDQPASSYRVKPAEPLEAWFSVYDNAEGSERIGSYPWPTKKEAIHYGGPSAIRYIRMREVEE